MARKLYARGYIGRPLQGQNAELSKIDFEMGDPALRALQDDLLNKVLKLEDWAGIRALLDCAIHLIGDPIQWILDNIQLTQSRKSLNADYLLDTIAFIDTGKRYMNQENWLAMHQSSVQARRAPARVKGNPLIAKLKSCSPSQVYQMWLSHPNGAMDLLMLLDCAFGENHVKSYMETRYD
jgi:hypothetical protein